MAASAGTVFRVTVVGDALVARGLRADAARVEAAVRTVVDVTGERLQAQAKTEASGRPGPNVITGEFRESIWLVTEHGGGLHVARVGSFEDQSLRLEFGFTGIDSLGRKYAAPPYPTFWPAADLVEPNFVASIHSVVASL